jgi:hypothetical protein
MHIVLCLAGNIILLQRGEVNDNSPYKYLVVVNVRVMVRLFKNILDMKIGFEKYLG